MLAGGFSFDGAADSSTAYVLALDLLKCDIESFLEFADLAGGVYAVHIDRNASSRFLVAGSSNYGGAEILVVF